MGFWGDVCDAVLEGERPEIPEFWPPEYVNIMKQCWVCFFFRPVLFFSIFAFVFFLEKCFFFVSDLIFDFFVFPFYLLFFLFLHPRAYPI
jgi:hypothetical protein